jgi:hypothetical protein
MYLASCVPKVLLESTIPNEALKQRKRDPTRRTCSEIRQFHRGYVIDTIFWTSPCSSSVDEEAEGGELEILGRSLKGVLMYILQHVRLDVDTHGTMDNFIAKVCLSEDTKFGCF